MVEVLEVKGGREGGENKLFFFHFRFKQFDCHLLGCAIAAAHRVDMSRRPGWFGVFLPPLRIFPLRCLASGTRSEALIWLPVRQQPFNNNAIVPHSSGPLSLIHPAVCRWYIVCDLRKHSPYWDVFLFVLYNARTHKRTVLFVSNT